MAAVFDSGELPLELYCQHIGSLVHSKLLLGTNKLVAATTSPSASNEGWKLAAT